MGSSRIVSPLTSADAASPCVLGETVEKSLSMDTYINDDSFVQQALLLGCHDKVVRRVLVVDNVLEINPCKEKHSDQVYQRRLASFQVSLCMCRRCI